MSHLELAAATPRSEPGSRPLPPAIRRLAGLTRLDAAALARLDQAVASATLRRARSELVSEGEPIAGPLLIVDGWAARTRTLADGRRQLISFILPGDLVGLCQHDRPLSLSTVLAITPVRACSAPSAHDLPSLQQAYAVSRAFEEAYLLAQITRLGRLDALDRICDLMLELLERHERAGLARDGSFEFPLTQELLGETLGVTSVHVNRMVQLARREGWLHWRGRRLTIVDREALAARVCRKPVRVQAEAG